LAITKPDNHNGNRHHLVRYDDDDNIHHANGFTNSANLLRYPYYTYHFLRWEWKQQHGNGKWRGRDLGVFVKYYECGD
jgi:hypothetical protein